MGELLHAGEERAWRGRLAELTTFTEGEPVDLTALATSATDALASFTGATATVYRPVRQEAGFGVDFVARRGLPASFVSDFRDLLAKTPKHLFLFDPTRPDPRERNVVRVLAPTELTAHASSQQALYRRYGMQGATQTRMLVCNGPVLLGWVGVFRDRPGTAARRDVWFVRSLGRALRRPLRLLHRLPRAGAGLFEGALEMLAGDAYLVTRSGRVETANRRGAGWLASGLGRKRGEPLRSRRTCAVSPISTSTCTRCAFAAGTCSSSTAERRRPRTRSSLASRRRACAGR